MFPLQINGISPSDVQSTSLSLNPQIDYSSDNTSQNITGDHKFVLGKGPQPSTSKSLQYACVGYQFVNGLTVKINGVTGDLLANVTDSAVSAGGDDVSIGSISVSLHVACHTYAALSAL